MSQTLFLLLGAIGLAGIGSLLSSGDDNDSSVEPEQPIGDRHEVEGTDENDTLDGTAGDDAILSYDGNDLVDGKGGDDRIWTGRGNDVVIARPGDDLVYLGMDDDQYGEINDGANEGQDTIVGGTGDDVLITNGGNHQIYGDYSQTDFIDPDAEYDDDDASDGGGDDRIYDNGGTVFVQASDGDDLIWSPDGTIDDKPDTLNGGEGSDTIVAGVGDLVDGGKGADLYILNGQSNGATHIEYGGSDNIRIALPEGFAGDKDYTLEQDGDNVRLSFGGNTIAVLNNVLVDDVREITFMDDKDVPKPPEKA